MNKMNIRGLIKVHNRAASLQDEVNKATKRFLDMLKSETGLTYQVNSDGLMVATLDGERWAEISPTAMLDVLYHFETKEQFAVAFNQHLDQIQAERDREIQARMAMAATEPVASPDGQPVPKKKRTKKQPAPTTNVPGDE